jgi:cell division protease FtsH
VEVVKTKAAVLHAAGKPFHDDASLAALAQQTPGFAGADLANLVNEAALLAARRTVLTEPHCSQ